MHLTNARVTVVILFVSAAFASVSAAERWNAFQNGGEVVVPDARLPLKWSAETGVAWKADLAGYGQSSPVVDRNLIYVTSTSGDMKEKLHIANNSSCTPVPLGDGKFMIGASNGRGGQSGGGAASNGVIQIRKRPRR